MTIEEKDLKYRKVRFLKEYSNFGDMQKDSFKEAIKHLGDKGWLIGFSTESINSTKNYVVAIIETEKGDCITRSMGNFIFVD